jgi:hypothetical protein
VDNQNGNHVIQKCVEKLSSSNIRFITDYFKENVLTEISKLS